MSGAVDVMVGDVWRYDERSADWDLVGEMREVASVREECGELYFRDKHGAGADVKFLVEHATLVSRAGQPVTAEHDRSGCAAFCGLRYSDSCFPTCGCFDWAHCTHAFFEDTIDDPIGWCSARCRDLRLPPIDSNRIPVAEARGADDIRRATPSSSPLTAVRDAHGTPTPARVGAQPGGSREERQTIAPPAAGSASPANVPPVPAVGQRWHIRSRSLSADDGIFVIEKVDERGFFPLVGHYEESGEPDSWGASIYVVADLLPPTTRHPAGITCRRCLVTSEHGDQHLETCAARDFAPGYRDLTSEEWTLAVSNALRVRADIRAEKAEPFVPSISDEELFGRPVR